MHSVFFFGSLGKQNDLHLNWSKWINFDNKMINESKTIQILRLMSPIQIQIQLKIGQQIQIHKNSNISPNHRYNSMI